jgi:hypothetical protein
MPTLFQIEVHLTTTKRRQLRYQFTPKHHGCQPGAACWHPDLTREQEFAVFDIADDHLCCDDGGNLYGVGRSDQDESLWILGTWNQQIALFPLASDGTPWHGYPLYPLNEHAPENRQGDRLRPPKEVFSKMNAAGLITRRERKRLMRGEEV